MAGVIMKNKKSQSTIEFIGVFSIFLILTSTFYLLFINYSNNIIKKRAYFQTENLLELISSKINTVVLEGDGYKTILDVPHKLLGSDYNITIEGNVLVLTLDKYGISLTKEFLPVNISGKLKKGTNNLKNFKGGVVIE